MDCRRLKPPSKRFGLNTLLELAEALGLGLTDRANMRILAA